MPPPGPSNTFLILYAGKYGTPLFKTLDCWYIYFAVEEYLRQELSAEEWQEAFEKPSTPKILSLAELIEKAQKQAKDQK